jgi:hypothetical protein
MRNAQQETANHETGKLNKEVQRYVQRSAGKRNTKRKDMIPTPRIEQQIARKKRQTSGKIAC